MSASRAWSWRHAVTQSDLPPTTRHVLLTLSIFMDETGASCFPSVEDLVGATGLSKRAVLTHLAAACDAGWLVRRQHGFRGQKWRRLEYEPLWPERDVDAREIDPGTDHEQAVEGGERGAPPSKSEVVNVVHEGGERRAPKVVNVVHQDREQSSNHSNTSPDLRENARAREGSKQTIRFLPPEPDDDAQFDELATLWPMKDKLVEARLVWSEMAAEDRDAALAYAPRYLSGLKGKRSFVEQLATWLRGRAWRVAGGASAATPVVTLSPYSRTFWAFAFGRLRRGERVGFMIDQAQRGTGPSVRADDMPGPDELAALVPVEVDSPAFDAWQQWFRSRQVASIRPDQARVIWCPSEWPAGMEAAGKAKEVAT